MDDLAKQIELGMRLAVYILLVAALGKYIAN